MVMYAGLKIANVIIAEKVVYVFDHPKCKCFARAVWDIYFLFLPAFLSPN